jgi:hypothetical protein
MSSNATCKSSQRYVTAWYDSLRNQYRPKQLRILLIAESPPDPLNKDRRFFYSPILKADNLYRGVAAALYGNDLNVDLCDKPTILNRFRQDGIWLIDSVDEPINKWKTAARRNAIRNSLPKLIEKCRELSPTIGVIICHGGVYNEIGKELRRAGVNVLHAQLIPFPLGNFRAEFISKFQSCLRSST